VRKNNGIRRLIEHARRAHQAAAEPAPFGFATRIVSRGLSPEHEDPYLLWDRMVRWSLAIAVMACLATAIGYRPSSSASALADFAGLNESTEGLW
jgi:hypothetical protein